MPASNRSEIRVKASASDRAAYEFGPYRFEPFNLRLLRGDEVVPLAGKAADTLHVLLRHADTLVSKDQLMAEVWPDAIVEENNLNQQIYLLRKALTHDGGSVTIETIPKRGYRLLGPVRQVTARPANPISHFVPAVVGSAPPAPPLARVRWHAVAFGVLALAVASLGGWPLYRSWDLARQSHQAAERGESLMREGNPLGAAAEYQEAIRLKPDNAQVYGALAHALNQIDNGVSSSAVRRQGESPSVQAAVKGVALDPGCGNCRGTLGLFLFYHDWKWQEAEREFLEAIRLAPGDAGIRPSYAMLLALTGRPGEALAQVDAGLQREPNQPSWLGIRASTLYYARRYDEAIAAADRLLAVQKNNRGAWDTRSKALFQLGRGEEGVHALAQNLLAGHSSDLDRAVGEGGAQGGLRKALDLTDDWRGRIEQSWRRASWRALLHDTDGALDELERAIASRRLNAINLGADPVYDGVRAHPRFRELLDRVGLTSYFSR